MKKSAAILLILYAIAMLSYGCLEMGHELLHYLAAHHHAHLHDHEHSHHHHFSDHQQDHHTHIHSNHSNEPVSELPSLISFFLYYEVNPSFSFFNTSFRVLEYQKENNSESPFSLPPTPPPQS